MARLYMQGLRRVPNMSDHVNCPQGKLPPSPNSNPKPNREGAIFRTLSDYGSMRLNNA